MEPTFRDYVSMSANAIQADAYYERNNDHYPYWLAISQAFASAVYEVTLARLNCKVFGHKIVEDDSYSCTGSGRVTVSCTRCGWSHTGYW